MHKEHAIVKQVYAAKGSMEKADELIKSYIPYIRAEVSKCISKICTEHDDEFSIGMIAFHEAIQGYTKERGAFLSYAGMIIRSRLIDFQRKEVRHQNQISLDEETGEDETTLMDRLPDDRDHYEERDSREATRQEIAELTKVMREFGISLTDVSENCPKQERTLEACMAAVRFAAENKALLDELLRSKKLPLAELTEGAGVQRKTLERHRKYILAMLLIQTNGYEIIRGHLSRTINRKGGAAK